MKEKKGIISMQAENSGSSQDKKQEDTKRVHDNESRVGPDTGGNEYTAAFVLYCQKTLDNFRHVYGDMHASEAGSGFSSSSSSSSSSGLGSSFGSSSGFEPESEDDDFELEQDDESQSDDYKEEEALRQLS